MPEVSIIIPLHNGESTIGQVLDSLMAQHMPEDTEVLVVNDFSVDGSREVVLRHPIGERVHFRLVDNAENMGLAATYNRGIALSKGALIVLLQQDCVPMGPRELEKLLDAMGDEDVVAAYSTSITPRTLWETYPFWQKVLFSRWVDMPISRFDGKLDCIRRSALERVGPFDERTFRTSGEDRDMEIRLKRVGRVVKSEAMVIHVQNASERFTFLDYIRKDAQLSEGAGAIFRKWGVKSERVSDFLKVIARPSIAVGVVLPYVGWAFIAALVLFSLLYARRALFLGDWRVVLVPFANVLSLYVSAAYFFRALLTGRQTL